ncbi:MAG: DNA-binding protein [Spirochaetia bacterium]|nr:DNA-binding protein [Spirochaetia bacterium]
MKTRIKYLILFTIIVFSAFCSEDEKAPVIENAAALNAAGPITGKVSETMDSGGYTYMNLEVDGKGVWIAASQVKVSVGDMVTFVPTTPMKDFHSKTLNKTFDNIYFVSGLQVGGKPVQGKVPNMPQANAQPSTKQNTKAEKANIKAGSIEKAKGGYTVAEIYLLKSNLNGKSVSVRGKVVKYTEGIMGKNWIHLQDGTGKESQSDLTITTTGKTKLGDVVLITGKASYDKDIGSGYFYPVIIEDAVIKN